MSNVSNLVKRVFELKDKKIAELEQEIKILRKRLDEAEKDLGSDHNKILEGANFQLKVKCEDLEQKVERLMHSLNDISERAEDLLKEDDFIMKLHIWSNSVIEFRKSLKDTEEGIDGSKM